MKLAPDVNGVQTISTGELKHGLWKIRISWALDGQEYFVDAKDYCRRKVPIKAKS